MRRHRFNLQPKHYIYSHFQFAVFPDVDLTDINNNKGLLYQDDAVYLRYFCAEHPTCPICLDEVNLPRLTGCGHLFCWRCLLQYFVMCPSPHKCPVCNAPICKPFTIVEINIQPPVDVGNSITFNLMKVPKGFTITTPANATQLTLPPDTNHEFAKYNHIVIEKNPLEILSQELSKVYAVEEGPQDENYATYYEMMKNEISDTEKEWSSRCKLLQQQKITSQDYNYYYQDVLGRNIYLVPFNTSMLLQDTSSHNSIEAKVLEIIFVDHGFDKRNQYKSLQHLPLGTEVTYVEVDLKSIVDASTMEKFKDVVVKRENKRRFIREQEEYQKEQERIEEMKRIQEIKLMRRTYLVAPEDADTKNIIVEDFPSLVKNPTQSHKKVSKWGVKKNYNFPALGGKRKDKKEDDELGEQKIQKDERCSLVEPSLTKSVPIPQIVDVSDFIKVNTPPINQHHKQKKGKKSRKKKIVLDADELGVYGDHISNADLSD